MSNRFCTNCGTQLGEGASFCTACGAPAAGPSAAQPDVQPPAEMAQPSPQALPEQPDAQPPPEMAQPDPEVLPEQPEQPPPAPPQPVPLGLRGRGGLAHEQHPAGEPHQPIAKSRPWGLIIGGAIGFWVLMGGVLILIGAFDESGPKSRSALPSAPAPRPMTMPSNALYFLGTWGPNCPQSTADAITFLSDGTFQAPGGLGTWTIDSGSTITMTGNGRTVTSRWIFSTGNSAVAYGMGTAGGQPVRRCS